MQFSIKQFKELVTMQEKYEIGYGKPPQYSRFKPGESGNKKGRPKGSKNTYTLINEILDQKITLKENGQAIKISKRAAMLTQLINKGVKGDVKAISVLFPHVLIADIKKEEKDNILATLNMDDQDILNAYLSNLSDFNGSNTIVENDNKEKEVDENENEDEDEDKYVES
jgi:hypothetical protein